MRVVAIGAGGMAVLVKQIALRRVVGVRTAGEGMGDLGEFRENVRSRRREIGTPVMTGDAVLLIGAAQQARGTL